MINYPTTLSPSTDDLLEQIELLRLVLQKRLNAEQKVRLGQFFTPSAVAAMMASMLTGNEPYIHILDAGAGIGTLFVTYVDELCRRVQKPQHVHIDMSVEQDPLAVKQRIEEALSILRALGLPRAQQNERLALTLLALLNLTPTMSWAEASAPLWGITPMMEFFERHYGKGYAPNTRETVRRQTVHQFLDAGLIVANPDEPERPVNSPKVVYQIEKSVLELFRSFGTAMWEKNLRTYLASIETLRQRYAQEREMQGIPV